MRTQNSADSERQLVRDWTAFRLEHPGIQGRAEAELAFKDRTQKLGLDVKAEQAKVDKVLAEVVSIPNSKSQQKERGGYRLSTD